jgi:hypothetical protein
MKADVKNMKTQLDEGLNGVISRPEFEAAQQATNTELGKLRVGIFGVSATAGVAAPPPPAPPGRRRKGAADSKDGGGDAADDPAKVCDGTHVHV